MRRAVVAAGVAVVVALAGGCTGHSQRGPVRTATSPTPSATPTPTPTPTEAPIDQVPPGRPASWVPKGVPTTAPYKEPGDVLPKFTLPLFTDELAGAQAAALYYIHARNWAKATENATPFLVVCDAQKCKDDAPSYGNKPGEHAIGGRVTLSGLQIAAQLPGSSSGADYVARVKVTITAGTLVDPAGKTIRSVPAKSQSWDLYLKWSGKMWRVTGHFLSS